MLLESMNCAAQVLDPYEIPVDARSAALGEGFVAVANSTAAMFYNVAGLAQQQGIAAQYGSRTYPISTPGAQSNYSSFSGMFGSQAFGTIGINYASHIYANPNTPVYNGAHAVIANNYNENSSIMEIAFAHAISPSMDAGASLGYTSRNISGLAGSAAYLDFGIRYHESLLKSKTPDEFSFGFSLTHLGSLISYDDAVGTKEDLPRTIRAGIAWRIAQPETSFISDEFLSAMITGQFKTIINQVDTAASAMLEGSNPGAKGYWSLGIEAGAWDIVFFRYGLEYRPYNSVYSYANNSQTNIGGGIKIPLHRLLGFSAPIYITVDYAAGNLANAGLFPVNSGHETLWTAGIHINQDLIPPLPVPQEGQ